MINIASKIKKINKEKMKKLVKNSVRIMVELYDGGSNDCCNNNGSNNDNGYY